MGGTKAEVRCKQHPKHRQSPGVCSVCLRERLSHLSSSATATTSRRSNAATMDSSCSSYSSSSSYSLSYLSSHCSSSESSPVHHLSFLRSRSMAAAVIPIRRSRENGKKKYGFWSKLLRPTSRKIDGGLTAITATVLAWR